MSDTRTQLAAMLFREIPGGYVYREPYQWPFGKIRHYLVNADQRAALLDFIVSRRPILSQVILWSVLCLIVAVACLGTWLYTGDNSPTAFDTIAIIVLTAAQGISAATIYFWWVRRRLRPLLAQLTPTDLQITQREMRAAATNAMSFKQLILVGVAAACGSSAMLINATIQLASLQLIGLVQLVVSLTFAGLAWYYFKEVLARVGNR